MSQGRNGQGHVGRATAWALLSAAALLVGTVMMGSAAFAADEPTTLGADAPTTTIAAPDPPVQTGDPAAPAADPPVQATAFGTFTKVFTPATIAPGAKSTLTFTIPVTTDTVGIAFTDTLPTGVKVASTPNKSTTCTDPGGAILTAVADSGSITFSGWNLLAAASPCTVKVDVTSSTPGAHPNTTSTLTSTDVAIPAAAAATATLTVTPGFSKVFSPATITAGGVSTLTYTVDNTGNTSSATALAFTDTLPTGLTVATVPTASTTCSGTWAPAAGSSALTFTGGTVNADAKCTIAVNVTSSTLGTYASTSEALTSSLGTGGTATATLTVAAATTATTLPVGATPAAAAAGLPLTGGPKTGLLAGIGLGALLLGALLVLGSSQRRRLARR